LATQQYSTIDSLARHDRLSAALARKPSMTPDNTTSYKVLLIEDNPGDARLIEMMLADCQDIRFEFVCAARLALGLDYLTQSHVDVLLLDLTLPDSYGIDTLIEVHGQTPRLPIVVLTGLDDTALGIKALQAGAQDFLVKGQVDGPLLTRALRYAIERKRSEEALQRAHDDLEYRVQERTEALQHANMQLHDYIEGLQRAEEAQRASENRYRLLVAAVKDYAIFMLDPDGYIINWNIGAQRIKGYAEQEIIGNHFSCFYPQDDIEQGLPEQLLRTAQAEGHCEDEGWRLRKDGSKFWASSSVTALFNTQRELVGFSNITRDMTARKQMEEALREALRAEHELNDLKTRFVSMVSHEFRTPLTTILAASNLLKLYRHKLTDAEKVDRLEKIEKEVKRMTQMLSHTLSFSRAEAGQTQVSPEPVDLESLCHEVIEEVQLADEGNHQFIVTGADSCGNPLLDEGLIRQLVTNLFTNAMKYSPDSSTIECQWSAYDDTLMLCVRDQGIGIPANDQTHLFEPFYRALNVTTISGTGLGLFIVKNAVDRHHGKIQVESEVGVGTTFRVTLPLLQGIR
jgi:PAS domain S-box-containing protein